MKSLIVADSSANLSSLSHIPFVSVPLTIVTSDREYIDNEALDVSGMIHDLRAYKGKSGTSCPSAGEWLLAFGDADLILGTAITSNLSGSFNSLRLAADMYMEQHPGKKVFIIDSLSTGPEMELLLEKMQELLALDQSFEQISESMTEYARHTHLAFQLASLSTLAKNGRVNGALARIVDALNIRIVGRASAVGDLEPLNKCKGERRALEQVWKNMTAEGYRGGKVRITHTNNPSAAQKMSDLITAVYPSCDISIRENRGLCSYYAEEGSVLVGFES